jgi:hypothetical protein
MDIEDFYDTFTPGTILSAEGARIGLVTCRDCGAAILIDPRDVTVNFMRVHYEWHAKQGLATNGNE